MELKMITSAAIERRRRWVEEIARIGGKFGDDTARLVGELTAELKKDGLNALVDHLHLCGAIPEHYGHDSSEEKLYSKYTDALLAESFQYLGLNSLVLDERADAADVEAVASTYSLVADAKAFRLSRTAKNQKDFKIEALHGWKRGKPHAMVVCPLYQLPTRSSQIYHQAISRNVCIFSYSHLAVLVQYSEAAGGTKGSDLLLLILKSPEGLNPGKDSVAYWTCLNRAMLGAAPSIKALWDKEKETTAESIAVAKDEALTILARHRELIMRMTHKEAIAALIKDRNLDGREKVIREVEDNGILAMS
jgi:HindIII restriction endonuclease